jgi:hypothetical protein
MEIRTDKNKKTKQKKQWVYKTAENITDTAPAFRLYTTGEVADLWNLSYWRVRPLVLDGTIRPIIGMGKGWMFDGTELKAAIDAGKIERL